MLTNVKMILVNLEGKFLLLHRDVAAPEVANKWSFVGGKKEDDETPEQGVLRETKEEIGFDVKEYTLLKAYHDEGIDRYVYVGTIDVGLDKLLLTEGDDLQFFTLEELQLIETSKNTERFLNDFLQSISKPS